MPIFSERTSGKNRLGNFGLVLRQRFDYLNTNKFVLTRNLVIKHCYKSMPFCDLKEVVNIV